MPQLLKASPSLIAVAATSLVFAAGALAQAPVAASPSVSKAPFWSQPDDETASAKDQAFYLKLSPQGCLPGSTSLLRLTGKAFPTTDIKSGAGCDFGDQPLRFRGDWSFGVSASNPLDRADFNDLCPADNCSIVSVELGSEPKKTTKTTMKWALTVNGASVASGSALFTRTVKKRGSKKSYVTTVKLR